jgi:hypothetical protein
MLGILSLTAFQARGPKMPKMVIDLTFKIK